MLLILPLFCFLLIFMILNAFSSGRGAALSLRENLLFCAVTFGCLLAAMTELLSLFNLITLPGLSVSWGALCLLLSVFLAILARRQKPAIRFKASKLRPSSVLLLGCLVFIVAATALIAYTCAPNDWDSMAYHMARVSHWIQDRNIAHYPTHVERQLHRNPLAEFAILHLQILSGSDRFAGFVQWLSMIGSIIGVSLIARRLGAASQGQLFAGVVVATIPMGILQSSGTLNDYAVSFWLVCFVYTLLLLKSSPRVTYALLAGAALGLAVLTKHQAYICALAFMAWLGLSSFTRFADRPRLWRAVVVMLLVALIINLGHYTRNLFLYGNILAGTGRELNSAFTPPLFASSVLKQIGLHLGMPGDALNAFTEKALIFVHRLLGVDISDPRTTFAYWQYYIKLSFYEDHAGNFAHLLLIMAAGIAILRKGQAACLKHYFLAMTCAFMLFSLLLKWTPWQSRLHLPLFVLWSAPVAAALSPAGEGTGFLRAKTAFRRALKTFMLLAGVFLAYLYFGGVLTEALMRNGPVVPLDRIACLLFGGTFNVFAGFFILALLALRYRSNLKAPVIICVTLFILALPWVFFNGTRRLAGKDNIFSGTRFSQYFLLSPGIENEYRRVDRYIREKGYKNVGLVLKKDWWEYPLLVILKDGNKAMRVEHVYVENRSRKLSTLPYFAGFRPEAIVDVDFIGGRIVIKDLVRGRQEVSYWDYTYADKK